MRKGIRDRAIYIYIYMRKYVCVGGEREIIKVEKTQFLAVQCEIFNEISHLGNL